MLRATISVLSQCNAKCSAETCGDNNQENALKMTGNAFLDLLIFALPALAFMWWWTGSKAHELATAHARQACKSRQLQFLDQTTSLLHLKPSRDAAGAFCWQRIYQFEFTDQGQFRDAATVTMHGQRLKEVHFPYTRDNDGNRVYLH